MLKDLLNVGSKQKYLVLVALTSGLCSCRVANSSTSVSSANEVNSSADEVVSMPEILKPFQAWTNGRIFSVAPIPVNSTPQKIASGKELPWRLEFRIFDFEGRDTYDTSFRNKYVTFDSAMPIDKLNLSQQHESFSIYKKKTSNDSTGNCTLTADLQYLGENGQELADPRSMTRPTGKAAALRSIAPGSYLLRYVRYSLETGLANPIALDGISKPSAIPISEQKLFRFVRGTTSFDSFLATEKLIAAYQQLEDKQRWVKRVSIEFGNNPFYIVSCISTAGQYKPFQPKFEEIQLNEALGWLSSAGMKVSDAIHEAGLNPKPDIVSCESRLAELDKKMNENYQKCLDRAAANEPNFTRKACDEELKPEVLRKQACNRRAGL